MNKDLEQLNWYGLHPIAMKIVNPLSDEELRQKIIEAFPLKEGEQYIGSLANHYRGRLLHEGKESLINQMDKNSMLRLIEVINHNPIAK